MKSYCTVEELLAYASGDLDAERARVVERHLAADQAAANLVQRYRSVRQLASADDSVAPTARAVERANALFESRRVREAVTKPAEARLSWLARFDALIADLLFDSRLQPIAVRRGQSANVVQLAYQAAGFEIELRASWKESHQDAEGTWRIVGQVSGDSKDLRASIVLASAGNTVVETVCDEAGMFMLAASAGQYDLCLKLPGDEVRTIVLPQIELP